MLLASLAFVRQATDDLGQDLSSMSNTSARLLDLLSLLQARRDWPGSQLAERLGVSGRTIRRDVERLRDLGYPVESLTGPAGGYRLAAGTAMPPLLLDEEEAIAIAVGLRTAARASVTGIEETSIRALVKLEQVLPEHLRRRVAALGSATVAPAAGGPTVDPQQLTTIAAACRDRECLRFDYSSRDGTATNRLVEPHSVVNLGRRWYLAAWDRRREDWRTFRVDRVDRAAGTGARFTPRRLPGGDAAAYVKRSIAGAFSRYEARVTVHAPAEALTRRMPFLGGALTPIDAERCEYRASEDDIEWLALRVAMLGVEVEVHEPPELAAQLGVLSRRLGRAAGYSPDATADQPRDPRRR
jgi:predicted DNA-binding transcriptional regulator YafY